MKRALSGLAVAFALTFALAACQTLGLESKPKDDTVDLACPPVETPAALTTMTKTAAGGVQATGNLRVTGTKCKVAKDSVKLTVTVELTATRGGALKGSDVSMPFFAAVVDASGNLSNKKLYETTFTYGDKPTDRETVTLEFEMAKTQAAATRVYVGYQLSQDAWQATQHQQ